MTVSQKNAMKRYINLERFLRGSQNYKDFFERSSELYNENTTVMFNPLSVRCFRFLLLDQD